MTNIAIIGLGLMGASFAKKLTHLNYNVYGIDVSKQTIDKAKELNIIVMASNIIMKKAFLDKKKKRLLLSIIKRLAI